MTFERLTTAWRQSSRSQNSSRTSSCSTSGFRASTATKLAERIRRAPGVQPVLVAITGWGQADDRRRSAEAGFDHHLVKPVDHDVLIQLVADAPAHVPH